MAENSESFEQKMERLLKETPKRAPKDRLAIFRVPRFITDKQEDLYLPQMVTIGPYHYNKKKFNRMQEYKLQYLHDFLGRNKQVCLKDYTDRISEMENKARERYSDLDQKAGQSNDTDFVSILLIDGCFILELLLKLKEHNSHHHFLARTWDFETILSDLLLIENQIPFFILEELYAVYNKNKSPEWGLKSLVIDNLFVKYLGDSIQPNRAERAWNDDINHLLHLYHEVSLANSTTKQVFRNTLWEGHRGLPLVIPSATRLLEFGFVLCKQDLCNVSDATFNQSAGTIKIPRLHYTIKIPQLTICSARKALLMNLLVFEQGLEESKRRWTGLLVMMNCMVKNKHDLEIVQTSGILLNFLPTDKEAIKFFAQMSKRITVDFKDHYYSELFEQINAKCEDYIPRKRARFMHAYFNNPWAVISFVTSICAILLSMTQTLVSVFTYRRRFH